MASWAGTAAAVVDLLSSRNLSGGGSWVMPLTYTSVDPAAVAGIFASKTRTPVTEDIEIFVIDHGREGGLTPEVMATIVEAAATSAATDHALIRRLLAVTDRTDTLGHHSIPVDVMTTADFFRYLVRLPTGFPNLLQGNAPSSVDLRHFEAYQTRQVRVVNDPDGCIQHGEIIELEPYLAEWASGRVGKRPILLMGERGAGKSWELMRFCINQFATHAQQPWRSGPAFYVNLRDLRWHTEDHYFMLARYILGRYSPIEMLHDAGMLHALLGTGRAVLCFDALDEFSFQPDDATVRLHLSFFSNLVLPNTRFLVSGRISYFENLAAILQQPLWDRQTIGSTFQVLALQPLRPDQSREYASIRFGKPASVSPKLEEDHALSAAIQAARSHPALLRIIADHEASGGTTALQALRAAIELGHIKFNLLYDKTGDHVPSASGEPVDLSLKTRLRIIEELAWYMAERGSGELDFARFPRKIRALFDLDTDIAIRDIRSHSVFQLSSVESNRIGTDPDALTDGTFRFVIPLDPQDPAGGVNSSLTGAYFLSRYILRRLKEVDPQGSLLPPNIRFRSLGRVPLSASTAAFVAAQLEEGGDDWRAELRATALELLRHEASNRSFAVFSPWYRFLVTNLHLMNVLSTEEADRINPWTDHVQLLFGKNPDSAKMAMVLVPPPTAEERAASPEAAHLPSSPVLLGVHEVTHREYQAFVESGSEGEDWRVERTTRAGARSDDPPSPYASLTNEYHLYYWRRNESVGGFAPVPGMLDHPSTYVSWFAAAAYCNWLSNEQRRECAYPDLPNAPKRTRDAVESGGYRLPTVAEWLWAARGRNPDVNYPWEMFPYYLPRDEREAAWTLGHEALRHLDGHRRADWLENPAAWYVKHQDAMKAVLLGSGEETLPVLYDEFNDCGLSGMLGNVKEWCNDSEDESGKACWIVGSTAYLEEPSFDYRYRITLFPENTNPDVGFRVARSLTVTEVESLAKREEEILLTTDELLAR
jgi:formylglycine-generating enzyme required for sulfatase activity